MKKILVVAIISMLLVGCGQKAVIKESDKETTTKETQLSIGEKETSETETVKEETVKEETVKEETVSVATVNREAENDAKKAREEIARKKNEELQRQQESYEAALAQRQKEVDEYNAKVELHNKRVENRYESETPAYLVNTVHISPSYVQYDDYGNLYAYFFITNGFNTPCYNINVEYIEVYGKNGLIAKTSKNYYLGDYKGIDPNSYGAFDYCFKGDEVKQVDADLSQLNVKSLTTYRY